ncbi:hypothetical protein [Bacillus sp. PS06]|uniref:hypothetical protein n=1 Tax=Bacillus sp. PS06 TaxID=2764176 RepID=UPI00177E9837|nr:hypothetical protein [Bacillus sp. PS06]MBD8070154.1 hypothetical protein [Bacillus sp. PS06]
MILAILALLAWIMLIIFTMVPKGLKLIELIFMYFLIGIFTITQFTILDVNLQWVPLTRSVEGSFAMYLCRFILIPFQVLLAVCILHSELKAKWRWLLSAIIVAFLCLEDRLYLWADLITYEKWNEFYAAVMYVIFIVLMWWIARWFSSLGKGEFKKTCR